MKSLFILSVLALALSACNSSANQTEPQNIAAPATTQETSGKEQAVQKEQGVWIDVRSVEEFNTGHLEGSLNVPVDEIGNKIQSIEPNKDAPINLYCRSGRRAEIARQTLMQMGYTNVTNHGGYEELVQKGYR